MTVKPSFEQVLAESCRRLRIRLTPQQLAQMEHYHRLLEEWNPRINLTAITDPVEAAEKLFVDSLCVLDVLSGCAKVLDIGSGAGFPGIVLKIARPDMTVHLAESIRKKVSFQKQVILELKLRDIHAHLVRLGNESPEEIERNSFDAVLFQAVGALDETARIALPYLLPQGIIVAMKGPAVEGEFAALNTAEVRVEKVVRYTLPHLGHGRSLVVLKKQD